MRHEWFITMEKGMRVRWVFVGEEEARRRWRGAGAVAPMEGMVVW